jgi:hypothetical protein
MAQKEERGLGQSGLRIDRTEFTDYPWIVINQTGEGLALSRTKDEALAAAQYLMKG